MPAARRSGTPGSRHDPAARGPCGPWAETGLGDLVADLISCRPPTARERWTRRPGCSPRSASRWPACRGRRDRRLIVDSMPSSSSASVTTSNGRSASARLAQCRKRSAGVRDDRSPVRGHIGDPVPGELSSMRPPSTACSACTECGGTRSASICVVAIISAANRGRESESTMLLPVPNGLAMRLHRGSGLDGVADKKKPGKAGQCT